MQSDNILFPAERNYVKKRVQRGIALLNTTMPDWREKVNKDKLKILSPNHCVLGQTHGDYIVGLQCLSLYDGSGAMAIEYGFGVCFEYDYAENLQAEWLQQLDN